MIVIVFFFKITIDLKDVIMSYGAFISLRSISEYAFEIIKYFYTKGSLYE